MLRRISHGDEEAFARLFHHYKLPLLAYAIKITRLQDAAEELVQEVFLKLWLHRESLRDVENASGYIFRITRNAAVDFLRRMSASTAMQNAIWSSMDNDSNSTQEDVQLRDVQRIVQTGVDQLPSQQQKVFQLSRQQGMSYEEIGEELGISANTVKNHLVKALKFLREYLEKHYGAPIVVIIMSFLEQRPWER
ncbi:MAG TPA: RNA polymerase sigma-70 factor [Chitinophagaceae bacterium]|nr:RNA polymerase sigma-70 factor [Chitinophagaceae bacterium]